MNPAVSPLPVGWQIIPSLNSKNCASVLQSQTGKTYGTYLEALRHLNYFDSNQAEIEVLRIGLLQEGWEAQPGLPSKWFTKEENGQLTYLSHDFMEFRSFTPAYDHLLKKKDEFEVDDLTIFYTTFSRKTPKDQKKMGSNSDRHLTKHKSVNVERKQRTVKKPVDILFQRLKSLVENAGAKMEIDKVVEQLKLEGWETCLNLPGGWLKKTSLNKISQYIIYEPFCAKFNSKSSATSSLRKMGFDKTFLAKFIIIDSDIDHSLNTENDCDWVSGNTIVPEGWKIRKDRLNSESLEFLSPQNICYKNRVDALKHMQMDINRDIFLRDEIENLKYKLIHEGWRDNSILPEGWKINRTKELSFFLTKDYFILEDYETALHFLKDPKNKFSNQERTNFIQSVESLKFNKTPIKLDIPDLRTLTTPTDNRNDQMCPLPDGWKLEELCKEQIRITAPNGSEFYTRLQAINYMIENDIDREIIYSFWCSLEKEGWNFGLKFVPSGWGVREEKKSDERLFLTRELEVLVNVEQALDYIENDDAYTGEDYKILKKWNDKCKDLLWIDDEDLPDGWKRTDDEDEEEAQFLCPLGNIITGRVALIEYFIKENHPPEEIFKLWGTLDLEGWMSDNKNLPLGWKRKYFPDLEEYQYLSPLMQVFKSEAELMKLVSDYDLNSDDEKLMVQHLKEWLTFNHK